jgi:eukaryotic-like serine/threonine-protein kinase
MRAIITRAQMIAQVATRLRDMHAAGLVHRAVKPSNIMWLPRSSCWTVVDFGCTVRIGEEAPVSRSLAYAAPEEAHALQGGSPSIRVSPAADAWALGVVAFEVLTGQAALNVLVGQKEVRFV